MPDRACHARRVRELVSGGARRRILLVGLASVAQHAVPDVDAPCPQFSSCIYPARHLRSHRQRRVRPVAPSMDRAPRLCSAGWCRRVRAVRVHEVREG